MLSGECFLLKSHILSAIRVQDERSTVCVPEGALILVIRNPEPNNPTLVRIRWRTEEYIVSLEDLENRGQRIKGAEVGHVVGAASA